MSSIERKSPQKLSQIDLTPRGRVHESPATWRDQILYFLLPDRFSDGEESRRPKFERTRPTEFKTDNQAEWMQGGTKFQGGTIQGIKSKLDYLQNLGVTTLWIAPIWQQRTDLETYHGYGIQNFLEVDPRFGTRQDLRDLIDIAHDRGMYVLLDIIYNHTGNNWFYRDESNGNPRDTVPYRYSPPYPVHSWHGAQGETIPLERLSDSDLEDGIWPEEFQNLSFYTRAGQIGKWDPEAWENPLHPDNEFRRGDFFELKDLNLNRSEVLSAVIKVYQYWIALSDCDGFRIDTVKHVPWEASRDFCGAIHEYAESIGKENFLLLGEVTGGARMAHNYLEIFGRNIDAVLDIGEPPQKLAEMVKGFRAPREFFAQFVGDNSDSLESHSLLSHRETGRYHVSILDDHDLVGREKQRFSADNHIPNKYQQVAHAVGVQLTTLGIPCIYYGTEQAFDGTIKNHNFSIESTLSFEDRYIRESMFGGTFGAFETKGCHFFDRDHPSYLRIAAIAKIRNRTDKIGKTLRRGRQYLRETSFQKRDFALPAKEELVAWSRILFEREVLIAINTHALEGRGADVTVDSSLSPVGSKMTFLYKSDWTDNELRHPQTNQTVPIVNNRGRATLRVDLPPAGMAILAKL